jgi:hypothetical protein
MTRPRTMAATALMPVLVAAALASPGSALAKGGGSPTPPAPAAAPVQCDYTLDGPLADNGGNVFSNQVNDAGCIRVVVSNNSTSLHLYSILLTPGWTYVVRKNGVGTDSTVLVDFANPTTGGKAQALIEFGKTSIR